MKKVWIALGLVICMILVIIVISRTVMMNKPGESSLPSHSLSPSPSSSPVTDNQDTGSNNPGETPLSEEELGDGGDNGATYQYPEGTNDASDFIIPSRGDRNPNQEVISSSSFLSVLPSNTYALYGFSPDNWRPALNLLHPDLQLNSFDLDQSPNSNKVESVSVAWIPNSDKILGGRSYYSTILCMDINKNIDIYTYASELSSYLQKIGSQSIYWPGYGMREGKTLCLSDPGRVPGKFEEKLVDTNSQVDSLGKSQKDSLITSMEFSDSGFYWSNQNAIYQNIKSQFSSDKDMDISLSSIPSHSHSEVKSYYDRYMSMVAQIITGVTESAPQTFISGELEFDQETHQIRITGSSTNSLVLPSLESLRELDSLGNTLTKESNKLVIKGDQNPIFNRDLIARGDGVNPGVVLVEGDDIVGNTSILTSVPSSFNGSSRMSGWATRLFDLVSGDSGSISYLTYRWGLYLQDGSNDISLVGQTPPN